MKSFFVSLFAFSSLAFAADAPKIIGPEKFEAYTANSKGCGFVNGSLRMTAKENSFELILEPGFDLSSFQVCDTPTEIRGHDMLEVTDRMAEYYSDCLDIVVDRQNKQIRVSPKPATMHVISEHETKNTYAVNGQTFFSTSTEKKDRWVCIKEVSVADEWMLKAVAAQSL